MKYFFSRPSRLQTEFLTEKGLRENNEDYCVIEKLGSNTYLLAVADGMGGKEGGEIASKIVILSITKYLKDEFGRKDLKVDLKEYLRKAFIDAQSAVSNKIATRPELKGMGTTLTALLISDGKYVWGNIGDSRLYIMSNGSMQLKTLDHSYIREYMSNHDKPLPPAILNQYSNIVTRIIDGGNDSPDIFPSKEDEVSLKEGDLFLLCSDGLISDKLGDHSHYLVEIIRKNKKLKRIAKMLVASALERGSDDNVTVVLGLFGGLIVKPSDEDYETIKIMVSPKT